VQSKPWQTVSTCDGAELSDSFSRNAALLLPAARTGEDGDTAARAASKLDGWNRRRRTGREIRMVSNRNDRMQEQQSAMPWRE
jgi:hypothetical protein